MPARDPIHVDGEAIAPRCEAERYRLYTRDGSGLHLIATTGTAGGVGEALVTLAEEGEFEGLRVGVLDGLAGKWLTNPFEEAR